MRCSCVPVHYGDSLVAIAQCVVSPKTPDRQLLRAVRILELTVAKACQDALVSDLSDHLDTARDQVAELEEIRNGRMPATNDGDATVAADTDGFTAAAGRSLVDRALEFIARHALERRFSLKVISRELGVNDKYLAHLFSQVVGQRMHCYLLQVRVWHACQLIAGTDKSIKEVAYESGFSRPDVFRRQFRLHVGVAPTAYRRAFGPV